MCNFPVGLSPVKILFIVSRIYHVYPQLKTIHLESLINLFYTTGLMPERFKGNEYNPENLKPCVFCEIVAGRTEAGIISRSKRTIAIAAQEDGYPLLITRQHFTNLLDPALDKATARELGQKAMEFTRIVSKVDGVTSVSVLINNGPAASQTVGHLHVHIMPREERDKKVKLAVDRSLSLPELTQKAMAYQAALQQI